MTTKVIVDGFNVIHKIEKYSLIQKKNFELSVDTLINDLVDLSGTEGWEICVVFDGLSSSRRRVAGVEVVFADKGRTADAIIERLSYKNEGNEVIVVTADYQQQKVIFRPGVERMTPKELEEKMKKTANRRQVKQSGVKRVFLEDNLPEHIRKKLDEMRKG